MDEVKPVVGVTPYKGYHERKRRRGRKDPLNESDDKEMGLEPVDARHKDETRAHNLVPYLLASAPIYDNAVDALQDKLHEPIEAAIGHYHVPEGMPSPDETGRKNSVVEDKPSLQDNEDQKNPPHISIDV
jgi:hypothetical protein